LIRFPIHDSFDRLLTLVAYFTSAEAADNAISAARRAFRELSGQHWSAPA